MHFIHVVYSARSEVSNTMAEIRSLFLFLLILSICFAKLPMFSWDTLPVYFHSSNASGPYTEESLKTIAKFQMVTIEKWQSYLVPGVDDEDAMMHFMKKVKDINPNTATYFYMGAFADLPEMTRMAREFAQHPDWYLRDSSGTKVMRKTSKISFYIFDLSNPDVRQWWQNTCLNALKATNGDGCFCDSSQQVNMTFEPPLSPEEEKAFGDSLVQLTKEVQNALGDDKLLIGKVANQSYVKAVQIEFFKPNNDSIVELMLGVEVGQVVQVHVPVYLDICNGDLTDYIAAFLIGAGEYSYFGCGRWNTSNDDTSAFIWRPEYDKPLGAPTGPATYRNGVWKRKFSRGTSVKFDTTTKTGTIEWGTS